MASDDLHDCKYADADDWLQRTITRYIGARVTVVLSAPAEVTLTVDQLRDLLASVWWDGKED